MMAFFMKLVLGITPACAGNRVLDMSRVLKPGDHPRVCGE